MTIREQIRLSRAIGWEGMGVLLSKGLISYAVYDGLRRDRVHEYLNWQNCHHWHPVITESRMARANFKPVGNEWKHRNPAVR